ncbi:ERV/ALR sulfhydryl oxidase domain-containing protein [Rhodocollybia butyracea]|uniref:Sulfhydryl oxidase n=1 Tax=Rhodocollybia butyracea TaxID=206335 RepID=A0A9P5Q7I6_9AGAR|nr:ERV/ALR sulfhydryl oxidase domain-containing protein [Rhodocollybia butyracea]
MISRFAKTFVILAIALFALAMLGFFHPPTRSYMDPWTEPLFGQEQLEPNSGGQGVKNEILNIPVNGVHGGVIMDKLGNETAKAILGQSTWKLLHTMTLRFPENPTNDERDALNSYFHLLSRLYPCGECASEFQALLKKYPPQTSSRKAASLWLCFVHNEVNQRLAKPEFDCAHLDDEYDCGCGDTPVSALATDNVDPMDLEADPSRDEITGLNLIKGG